MKIRRLDQIIASTILVLFLVTSMAQVAIARPEPPIDPPTTYTYTISGRVKNAATGVGLSGATVKIYRGSTYIKTITSGSDGSFYTTYRSSLWILSFKVVVSKTGFATRTVTTETQNRMAIFGNILLTPLASYDYTIHGTVTDDEYGWEVPEATVVISKWTGSSWVSIGTTATASDSGDFTYSYTSIGSTISDFRTVVSKVGYETKSTEAPVVGDDCEINAALTRTTVTNIITSNPFEYANQEAYELWWKVDPEYAERHTTTCEDGVAMVSEVYGVPDQTGLVVARGPIDLSMWTESSDLTITVRFRAMGTSSSSFWMGLTEPSPGGTIHWDWDESWSTSDTGWITISDTIIRSTYPDGFSDAKAYSFYWGFLGSSDDDAQSVMIDSFEIEGDRHPEGVLTQTYDGVSTTVPDAFPMGSVFETDIAILAMTTKFGESYNSLGVGHEPDPLISSGIWITLDDDFSVYTETEGSLTYYVLEYNTVDYVKINIEIVHEDGTPLPNQPEIVEIWTNEDNAYGMSGELDMSGPLGISLELVGLLGLMSAGPVGAWIEIAAPLMKFVGQILAQGVDTTIDIGRASLEHGQGTDSTEAWLELDYDDVTSSMNAYLPKAGSRDFKLELDVIPHFVFEGIYHINIDFDVVLKHYYCRRLQTFHLWNTVVPTLESRHYDQDFDMIWYQDTSRVHVVELDPDMNGDHIFPQAADTDTTKIHTSRNGVNWYVVAPKIPTMNPSIMLTADSSFVEGSTYIFYEMLVSKWSIGWEQKEPAEYLNLILTIELDQYSPFYSFGAIYT